MMSVIKVIGMVVLLSFVGGCGQRSYSAEFEKARTSMRDAGIPEETITKKMQEIEITVSELSKVGAPTEDIVKTIQAMPKSVITLIKIEQAEAKRRAEDAALLQAMKDAAKNVQRYKATY